eukprot:3403168-Rhodomonas_salina.4
MVCCQALQPHSTRTANPYRVRKLLYRVQAALGYAPILSSYALATPCPVLTVPIRLCEGPHDRLLSPARPNPGQANVSKRPMSSFRVDFVGAFFSSVVLPREA